MALNINGTTGISGVDGSASAPALQGTDSNTGFSFGTDTVNINTGGSTRATVNSSGNVGIGTSSPAGVLHVKGSDIVQYVDSSNTAAEICFRNNTSTGDNIRIGGSGNNLTFDTGGSERMRINSSGKVLVGTTNVLNSSMLNVKGTGVTCISTEANLTSAFTHIIFVNPNGNVGEIRTSGNGTSFTSLSDYRLKENAVAISDGITRLKTLKPYKFNFKNDASTTVDGFFAHEVTAVPEAISGIKDEVVTQSLIDSGKYKEGTLNNPIYQGIDQSKLVPLLTAALQEAIAKIEVLEAKVAALEAK